VAILATLGGAGFTFGMATPAFATGNTLYVSSTGSDTGSCTLSTSPCATISYAVSQASDGDTIYVSGTIDDIVSVDIPLTIAQWPDASPAVVDGTGRGSSVVTIEQGGIVTIDQLTITGGQSGVFGGGIENEGNLTINGSTISGNTAGGSTGGDGGGIRNYYGTLSIDDSTISDNSIFDSTGGFPGDGGGIYNDIGTISIDNSTISGNSADGSSIGGLGGGYLGDEGTASIDDSTISGNSTTATSGPGGSGAGIYSADESLTLDDSTISGNTVSAGGQGGAGIFAAFGGGATLAGDILASSGGTPLGGECVAAASATITDDGYNIDDDGTCGFSSTGSVSDSTTIDNYLGPLQKNTGPTDTIALLPGNSSTPDPAQGVIPSGFTAAGQSVAVCSQPDQRGVSRGAPCDMGAYALTPATTQLYALPDGSASAPCITESTTPSLVCSLDTAVAEANSESGDVINLEAPIGDSLYTGVSDAGVGETVTEPVTIQADSDAGFDTATPTLDGEDGSVTVLSILDNVDVTVSGIEIENGVAGSSHVGGAIYNGGTGTVTVSNTLLFQCTSNDGAAISNSNGGTLDVSDSTFEGGYAEGGSGIANGVNTGSGTLFVTDSLFFENEASVIGGGAILNGYGAGDHGTATITDSTFSLDTTLNSNNGGAIDNGDGGGTGTLAITSSTFTGNSPGDILNAGGGTITSTANIFTDSCTQDGTWTDGGWNVGADTTCFNSGAHDDASAGSDLPALMGDVTDNGGPTQSSELLVGNPAIEMIPDHTSGLCPVAQDQRGDSSPAGSACSVGAVQYAGQTIGSPSTPPSSAVVGGPGYTPSASASSGLAVAVTADGLSYGVCTVSAGVFSYQSTGTCTVDFDQAGDDNWAPATEVQQSFPVGQGPQSIGSLSTSPSSALVGGSSYTPTATATSGLAVSITVDPSATDVCSIFAGVVSFESVGTCTLDFNQVGNSNWLPASQVQQNFAVSQAPASQAPSGYRLARSDGGVFFYGDQTNYGSHAGSRLNKPIVGIATTPSGNGYWLVAADGGVFAYGDATFHGSHAGSPLSSPIVGIAATPSGNGYWLVAADGGVFAYGDATFFGSHAGSPLNSPIVGIASTPYGNGYWLAASDGGVFSYGGATYDGSHAGTPLNKPIVGITASPTGNGYWLVASDGGVFSYGGATYSGSHAGTPLNKPIVGITASPTGNGYWLVGSDGGVFCYGDATYDGSMGGSAMSAPVVGIG